MIPMFLALAAAQPASPVAPSEEAIVVTARRSGIPVWRISKGPATVVLVGTIADITRGTTWSAAALESAVAQSRRVVFPQTVAISLSPADSDFWNRKWEQLARLPADRPLTTLVSTGEQARIAALVGTGLAPRDWSTIHPMPLALAIQTRLRKLALTEGDIEATVDAAIKANKVFRVPVKRANADTILWGLVQTRPADHLDCLRATLALAEAGPAELRRRSTAWAARDVRAAVASPVAALEGACWPGNRDRDLAAGLLATTRGALKRKGVTLAVVNIDSLARPDGLLDRLAADGAAIDGPAWR